MAGTEITAAQTSVPSGTQRILVIQTSFLGDAVLATPVLTNLRSLYPESRIDVLTTPAAAFIVKNHPAVDEVLTFDKRKSQRGFRGMFQLASILRRRQYTTIFSLHKSWRTAAIVWLSRTPQRFGFSEAYGRFFYTKTVPRMDQQHDVLRQLAILRAIGKEPHELNQSLELKADEPSRARIATLQLPLNFALLVPGSAWATKRWPAERFGEVARALHQQGVPVVVVGGDAEQSIGQIIEKFEPAVINLIGKLSLLESLAVVERSMGVITNDTGLLHFASAALRPTVAIFCATLPEFGFTPWKNPHEILEVKGLACRPCRKNGGSICPTGTLACQLGISSQAVVAAFGRVVRSTAEFSGATVSQ